MVVSVAARTAYADLPALPLYCYRPLRLDKRGYTTEPNKPLGVGFNSPYGPIGRHVPHFFT